MSRTSFAKPNLLKLPNTYGGTAIHGAFVGIAPHAALGGSCSARALRNGLCRTQQSGPIVRAVAALSGGARRPLPASRRWGAVWRGASHCLGLLAWHGNPRARALGTACYEPGSQHVPRKVGQQYRATTSAIYNFWMVYEALFFLFFCGACQFVTNRTTTHRKAAGAHMPATAAIIRACQEPPWHWSDAHL